MVVAYYRAEDVVDERCSVSSAVQSPIVAEYREVRKRPKGQRRVEFPALERAIRHAQKRNAPLVIAKIGSLVRSVPFTRLLLDAANQGLDFRCLDLPHVNHLTIRMVAEQARYFATQVSQRTRDGLKSVKGKRMKRRGAHLRNTSQPKAIKVASARRHERAQSLYGLLLPKLRELRESMTFDQLAEWLNENGHRTTIGTPFNGPTVCRILQRSV